MKIFNLFSLLFIPLLVVSQTTTRLQTIPELTVTHARLWDMAQKQHGVIGSDFRSKSEIGTAAAERFGGTFDVWYPIDVFKKTIGGELDHLKIYHSAPNGEGEDNDHNFHIKPTADFQADFKMSIDKAVLRMDDKDPLVDADFEWERIGGCTREEFKQYQVKTMEFEIDLHKSSINRILDHNKPAMIRERELHPNPDTVFAYGPWVSDAAHCYKPEIHPAEQVWWRRKLSAYQTQHFLLLTCDQSDRFDEATEFDTDEIIGQQRYLKNVWAPRPLKGTFAILFAIQPANEKFDLSLSIADQQNVSSRFNDGKLHYLIYRKDTIAVVREPGGTDNLRIGFEQVHRGFDDKTIYGYITIDAQVGIKVPLLPSQGGFVFLKAVSTRKGISRPVFTTPK